MDNCVMYMPLLPAHIGPAVLIGGLAGRKLNFTVLILSTLLIDLEVLVLGLERGLFIYHGFLHTFTGATLFGFIFGTIFFILSQVYWKGKEIYYRDIEIYKKLKEWRNHNWTFSYKCTVISAIIGAYSHIALDWLLYEDISVFIRRSNIYYDFTSQYFYETNIVIYIFCVAVFMIGLALYIYRYTKDKNKWYKISSVYELRFHKKDLWTGIGIVSTPFAIAGIVVLILMIITNAGGYPILFLSIGSIVLMVIGYIMSLRNLNWKLFE